LPKPGERRGWRASSSAFSRILVAALGDPLNGACDRMRRLDADAAMAAAVVLQYALTFRRHRRVHAAGCFENNQKNQSSVRPPSLAWNVSSPQ
jgi:hypothetical protein